MQNQETQNIAHACPNAQHMGEYACKNKSQCWEPCGELGKSEQHVRVYTGAEMIDPDRVIVAKMDWIE